MSSMVVSGSPKRWYQVGGIVHPPIGSIYYHLYIAFWGVFPKLGVFTPNHPF